MARVPVLMNARWKFFGKVFGSIVLAASSLVLFSGCAVALVGGAAAGAGAVAYVRGELKAVEFAPLDKAWAATQAAVKELEFTIISPSKDALSAQLVARTAGDKKIEIRLKKVSERLTEIRIRVGMFGDESTARLILEKIKKRL